MFRRAPRLRFGPAVLERIYDAEADAKAGQLSTPSRSSRNASTKASARNDA